MDHGRMIFVGREACVHLPAHYGLAPMLGVGDGSSPSNSLRFYENLLVSQRDQDFLLRLQAEGFNDLFWYGDSDASFDAHETHFEFYRHDPSLLLVFVKVKYKYSHSILSILNMGAR